MRLVSLPAVLASTALFLASSAEGQQFRSQTLWHPKIPALDQSGFASADDVTAAVGNVSTVVDCPQGSSYDRESGRGARVTVEKPGLPSTAVLSTLLGNALFQIWDECNSQMGSFGFGVRYVEVYAPDHDGGDPELVYRVDHFIDLVNWEGWTSKQQIPTREQQAAQQAAQQQAAAQAAQQQAAQEQAAQEQAAQQAQQQAAQAAQAQAEADARQREWDQTVEGIKTFGRKAVEWGVPVALVLILIAARHSIARLYYFYFHPHPATPLVRAALATGTVLDGKALANALSEIPPGSRVLRAVRLEQAETLFHEMKQASERHLQRQKVEAERKAKTDLEHAAIYSIQEAVALAAVALERAKALYRTSQQIGVKT